MLYHTSFRVSEVETGSNRQDYVCARYHVIHSRYLLRHTARVSNKASTAATRVQMERENGTGKDRFGTMLRVSPGDQIPTSQRFVWKYAALSPLAKGALHP